MTHLRQPSLWHLVTCEFPPQVGGIADFSRIVGEALAARGEEVHVWSPSPASASTGTTVHALPTGYALSALGPLGARLDKYPAPRRLFLQWVPHGYGYKSLNLPFCLWVWWRARLGDRLHLMVHEPYLRFDGRRLRRNVGALAHRLMLMVLLRAADRVWVSTSSFLPMVRRLGPRRLTHYAWLPVPSPVTPIEDHAAVNALGLELGGGRPLVGYFGTASPLIAKCLAETLEAIASRRPETRFVLVGVGTDTFARDLIASRPGLGPAIVASGPRPSSEVSRLLQCCDLFVQPYPDGASTRRTTLMALLEHGRPVVTNAGPNTEPLWSESEAVQLVPSAEASAFADAALRLVHDAGSRERLATQARRLYRAQFDVTRTLAVLLGTTDAEIALEPTP